jgi:hypothetical protein
MTPYRGMGYTNRMESSAEDTVRNSLINPYYAISFADYLFDAEKPEMAKEDWVLANGKLLEEKDVADWLEQLLVSLSMEPLDKPVIISPAEVVVVSKRLHGEHDPVIDSAEWIAANVKLMKELGTEAWLWRFLEVLENGGPTG